MNKIIEIKSLSKIYTSIYSATDQHAQTVMALDHVDVTITQGEFVAIMGPSGSGKSTLMQILGLLDMATSGNYYFKGQDVSKLNDIELAQLRSKKIGFIFQFFNLLPRTTSVDNVSLPLVYSQVLRPEIRAKQLLDAVGMSERYNHKPHQLSGGQQQRVAIARALANRPEVIFADEPTGNISTQQTTEVLDMLDELNLQGTTIVLVTHEPEVAARARRLITFRDGKIFSDEVRRQPLVRCILPQTEELAAPQIIKPSSSEIFNDFNNLFARVIENFKMAKIALSLNKLRTSLATLGVIIGIASFVAMMAIGEGAKKQIEEQISSFGTNILYLRATDNKSTKGESSTALRRFTLIDFELMQNWIKGQYSLKNLDAQVGGSVTAAYKSLNTSTELIGATPKIQSMQNYKLSAGRFFTDEENKQKSKVIVIGQTVVDRLYNNTPAVGSILRVNQIDFDVIGVLEEKGSSAFRDNDDILLVPLETAMFRVFGRKTLNSLSFEVLDSNLIQDSEQKLSAFLRDLRKLEPSDENNFEIRNMNEIKKLYTQTTNIISSMLKAIAAVALLVGGIGIMNVMFVSVKERTREVGLRKALGAKKNDILIQFLIESIIIGLLGGGGGFLLGLFLCQFANYYLGWQAYITLSSVIVSFSFSVAVGVVFGLWPAKQASELSPIEALRFE